MSQQARFLASATLAAAGTLLYLIDATAVLTRAGGAEDGGKLTAAYLAFSALWAAILSTQTAKWMRRWGPAQALSAALLVSGAALFVMAGSAWLDGPTVVIFLAATPFIGLASALNLTAIPQLGRLLVSADSSQMWAKVQMVMSPGYAAGALIASFFIDEDESGLGIAAGAVLTLPMVVFLLRLRREELEDMSDEDDARGTSLLSLLWSTTAGRTATLAVTATTILVAPLSSMFVPVTDKLDQAELIRSAGLFLAAVSIGWLGVPLLLARLRATRWASNASVSAVGLAIAGGALIAMAAAARSTEGDLELMTWIAGSLALAAGMGVSTVAALGLLVDDASGSDSNGRIAALAFVQSATKPVGFLYWGWFMDEVGVEWLVASCGVLALVIGLRVATRVSPRKTTTRYA